jgi:hypothetical protein
MVPENAIGKDKDNTETSSRWAINFYYVNRIVNICSMSFRVRGRARAGYFEGDWGMKISHIENRKKLVQLQFI